MRARCESFGGILGADFRGWLVTDFYAAYNLIPSQHQRCWAHLLRDLHTLKETHAEQADVLEWSAAVRSLRSLVVIRKISGGSQPQSLHRVPDRVVAPHRSRPAPNSLTLTVNTYISAAR
jgi:hypothetical protein